jgi:hypothetical protein
VVATLLIVSEVVSCLLKIAINAIKLYRLCRRPDAQ